MAYASPGFIKLPLSYRFDVDGIFACDSATILGNKVKLLTPVGFLLQQDTRRVRVKPSERDRDSILSAT